MPFTADDEGRAQAEQSEKPRARQNVVFEAGYFIGRLGRENVAILVDKGIEIPPIYRASFIPEQTVGSSAS